MRERENLKKRKKNFEKEIERDRDSFEDQQKMRMGKISKREPLLSQQHCDKHINALADCGSLSEFRRKQIINIRHSSLSMKMVMMRTIKMMGDENEQDENDADADSCANDSRHTSTPIDN